MTDITPSSGSVYVDLDIEEPKHGEVRSNGDDTYVWDSSLKAWIQTAYAEDRRCQTCLGYGDIQKQSLTGGYYDAACPDCDGIRI